MYCDVSEVREQWFVSVVALELEEEYALGRGGRCGATGDLGVLEYCGVKCEVGGCEV